MGTAILGGVLVCILLAGAQMQSQARRAQGRIEACRVLDDLLGQWWQDTATIPRSGGGQVPSHEGWAWSAQRQDRPEAKDLCGEVVAVRVFAANSRNEALQATVELLLPVKNDDETSQTQPSANAH